MRPTKRSRSVNKWHDNTSDIYSVEDVNNSKRDNDRKRKLPDTPQWSKEELSRFYTAYREYGKDWKKVAAVVRNRSIEKVESLYKMNMAYLSLPEGTATVVGFIAMMLDHYSNLATSNSEQESSDGPATCRKPKKRARDKAKPSNSEASNGKFSTHSAIDASKHSRGSKCQVARKRTPRLPVSYSCENVKGDKSFSSTVQNLEKKADPNEDAAALEIELALREALAKGGPALVSQAPNRTADVMFSPAENAEVKHAQLIIANGKTVKIDRNHAEFEECTKAGQLSTVQTSLKQSGRVGSLVQKGRIIGQKKLDADNYICNDLDDRTEVGQTSGAICKRLKRDARICRSSLQCSRNKNKKVLFNRDEASAIEALQTLADMSLKMPTGGHEDELVQIKEEKDDHLHESASLESMPGKSQRDKHRYSGFRVKGDVLIPRPEVASCKIPKLGEVSAIDDNAVPEMEKEAYQFKTMRKKPNTLSEARDVKKMNKSKRSSLKTSPIFEKNAENSSRNQSRREGSDPSQLTVKVCQANQIRLPTKVRGRRKMHLKTPQNQNVLKSPAKVLNEQSTTVAALVYGTAFTKEKIINCLSNHLFRRWCRYEWLYSAIDYPWFAKREFIQYLCHVGLGHVPNLTRVEWGVIRSSLGKPRRFSQQYLKEERKKLYQYRDSVRKHYTDVRKGTQEGTPKDLARPLSVGQHVIAVHPKTRETSEGNVLAVDYSTCRVQFDRHELGDEYVMDIDCMPVNYLENIPTPLTRRMTNDKVYEYNEFMVIEQAKECKKAFPCDEILDLNCCSHLSPSSYLKLNKMASEDANLQNRMVPPETCSSKELIYSQPCTLAEIQAKEAEVHALAESTRTLDKKEATDFELKHVNSDLVDNCFPKESEPSKKQCAAVLVKLQKANEQTSSLSHLRKKDAFQETIPLQWPGSVSNLGDNCGPWNSLDHSASRSHLSGSHVNELIESSRIEARTMVNVAMQTVSSLEVSENTIEKIEEAIDIVNKQLPLDAPFISLAPDPMMTTASERNALQIPSELITQCVATLLMIRKCTEGQFPPADIAQILHSALRSLKPSCSQNLPAYTEIQKCMGMIRNQILSLLPV